MEPYGQQRQTRTFDVTALNLKCANCGVDIVDLPFEPTQKEDGTYGRIYCRDCNRERKRNFSGGGGGGGFRGRGYGGGGGGGGFRRGNE